MNSSAAFQQNPDTLTRTIDGLAVIMDPENGKVLSLNEVGTFIWEMAQHSCSKEEILNAVCSRFEVRREKAAVDLEEFILILRQKELLATIEEI